MATSPAKCDLILCAAAPPEPVRRDVLRRRKVSPRDGRALEILGHAIDYLTDEFVHAGGALSARDPLVEAVQLLMRLNREIYFNSPEVPTLVDRLRAFLRQRPA